jgi:hypothetical protein
MMFAQACNGIRSTPAALTGTGISATCASVKSTGGSYLSGSSLAP